ncbi:hypothetical protein TL16_g10203 [Triparma laevis f. inornata]|uniref:Uncharacterized protein n=1 Tax=Triparma laevis f. inornata TaxID=1714386 RepID=A0A9W7ELN5_9STRA|nr:hypothetical protein TL16_g10203 [Triparma laevis f. inornata]
MHGSHGDDKHHHGSNHGGNHHHHHHHNHHGKHHHHHHRKHKETPEESPEEAREREKERAMIGYLQLHSSKKIENEPDIDTVETNRQIQKLVDAADRTVTDSIPFFKRKHYMECSLALSRAMQEMYLAQALIEKRDNALKASTVKLRDRGSVSGNVWGGGGQAGDGGQGNENKDIDRKIAYVMYKRGQCSHHLQNFQSAVEDCTESIARDPTSPYIGMVFLLKGLSLGCLGQFANSSATLLHGLKIAPYDLSLRAAFDQNVSNMKQQYHKYSTDPAANRETLTGAKKTNAHPERGYNDRQVNSLLSRVSSTLPLSSLIQEEVSFWATYGVYLAKRELKEDTYKLVVVYKEVLKGVFERFCKLPSGIVRPTASVGGSVGGGARRPTFKDAAKLVMQQGRRRSSRENQVLKTANGLQSEGVRSAIQKNQEVAETVKASSMHVAFKPVFLKRQMTGVQYLEFCTASGLIDPKYRNFGYETALDVLKKVTKNVRLHMAKQSSHHHHSHHVHHGGGGEGDSDSESETDSFSSFDSEASEDEFGDEDDDDDEEVGKDKEFEELVKAEGETLDIDRASVRASEYTLLFPHFIECIVRLILLRYEPVVPKEIVETWKRDQEDYMNTMRGGGDGGGDGYAESVSSIDSRRMSRASRASNGTIGQEPMSLPRRGQHFSFINSSPTRLNSQENMFRIGMAGFDTGMLPLAAVRLKFGIDTHLLPLFGSQNAVPQLVPGAGLDGFGGKDSQSKNILKPHLPRLHKIFKHFAHKSEGHAMHVSEFIYMLMRLNLLDTKMNGMDAANLIISASYYTGASRYDHIKFGEFCETLIHVAEFKTYDGVCSMETRINSWLSTEVYTAITKYTTLDTKLW